MKGNEKLVQKVKRLVKRAGLPRWLNQRGSKKYEFWQHLLALLFRQEGKYSYRRTSRSLRDLGFPVPTYSALAKMVSRIPSCVWQMLLKATANHSPHIVAIDSTWFARSNPSYHYQRRIDRKKPPGIPIKVSVAVDTAKKVAVGVVVRILPRGDTVDVAKLLDQSKPQILVADKGYDSEAVHRQCDERQILSMIPKRDWVKRGWCRRKMMKNFRKRTYNRRAIAEAFFSAIKRKFGTAVLCQKARSIRAEIYCRLIAHNLKLKIIRNSTKPLQTILLNNKALNNGINICINIRK